MRLFGVFSLACLFGNPLIAQETSAEVELGEFLTKAIAENDVVAYSQCWISLRRMTTKLKEIGVDLPPEETERMPEYIARRNRLVAESFRKIQALIDSAKIDRQSIRLKTCEAGNVQARKAPKGSLTKAQDFSVVISVGAEEWRFEIDDGVMDNGMWYFSDRPMTLYAGDTTLRFRADSR